MTRAKEAGDHAFVAPGVVLGIEKLGGSIVYPGLRMSSYCLAVSMAHIAKKESRGRTKKNVGESKKVEESEHRRR